MVMAKGHTQARVVDLQRIFIEEGFAVQGQAGDHAVVQGTLSGITIAGIGGEKRHAAGEQGQTKGGAGFGIGGAVGQMIGHGKGFASGLGTDSAGDVHLLFINIVEQALGGSLQLGITQLQSQIGNGTVQIYRTHRMTQGLILLRYRHMELRIGTVILYINRGIFIVCSAPAHKKLGQVEITAIVRGFI